MTMNLNLKVALNRVLILTFVLTLNVLTIFAIIFNLSLKLTLTVILNQTLIPMPS